MTTEPPHLIPSEGGLTETILHRFCPWCKNEFKFGDMFCEVCGSSRGSIKVIHILLNKLLDSRRTSFKTKMAKDTVQKTTL